MAKSEKGEETSMEPMIFIKYSYEFEIRVELAEVQDPSMIKNL
jgi:hypothetical protein